MSSRRIAHTSCAALALAVILLACSPPSPDPSGSSAAPVPAATPDPTQTTSGPIPPVYQLSAGSHMNLEVTGKRWDADKGSMSIRKVEGGSTKITVKSPPGAAANGWELSVVVNSLGRAVDGYVTAGGAKYLVVANTGLVSSVVAPASARIWTARAITVNVRGPSSPNSPMTLELHGKG